MHPDLLPYSQATLHALLQSSTTAALPLPPAQLLEVYGHEFMLQVQRTVECLAAALKAPIQMTWDMEYYSKIWKARGPTTDDIRRLCNAFPPLVKGEEPVITFPCTLIDCHRRIIMVYLPEVLDELRQIYAVEAARLLEPVLKLPAFRPQPGKDWRRDPAYFRPAARCSIPPGIVDLSPAWYMQGHPPPMYNTTESSGAKQAMKRACMGSWEEYMRDLSVLVDLLIASIHPDQFRAARELRNYLHTAQDPPLFLRYASSIYSGVELISNRQTKDHVDGKGRKQCLDMLVTVGPYLKAEMRLADLGLRFAYPSGTVVAIAGGVARHSVEAEGGERICWAYFMREELFYGHKSAAPTWPSFDMVGQVAV